MKLKRWGIYTLVGALLGCLLGYLLSWIWFFFRLVFLGYGDSGPSWIISVNHIVFMFGLVVGIIGGQILFIMIYIRQNNRRQNSIR